MIDRTVVKAPVIFGVSQHCMITRYAPIACSDSANEQNDRVVERGEAQIAPAGRDRRALGKTLEGLIGAESVVYAVTREWRYHAANRGSKRSHALLDEQFTEIGVRLMHLAARSRAIGGWNSTGHGDIASMPRFALAGGALQTYMIHERLTLRENLAVRLQRTRSVTGGAVRIARPLNSSLRPRPPEGRSRAPHAAA